MSLPLHAIVAGLNALQPEVLFGYSSALNLIAGEALRGALEIRPRWIMSSAEPLLPEMVERIERAFGVRPVNVYGSSDVGLLGSGCGAASGMHLSDDLLIVEPVDESGMPVSDGKRSAKLLVTELACRALPLLRYEITDEVAVIDGACACGSAFTRIADIQGRLDDVFEYEGGVKVHPHVFRSPLTREPKLVEYQVRQSRDGAEILLVASGEIDARGLEQAIETRLEQIGVAYPSVSTRFVDAIPRVGIGKLKRFVSR